MRHVSLLIGVMVMLSASGGCTNRANVQCEADPNCNLTTGGVCSMAQTGNHWCAYPDPNCPGGLRFSDQDVGDGVSGSCVDPAGVDGGVDASPDGPQIPGMGQVGDTLADLVIGQFNYNTSDSGPLNTSASSLESPTGVAIADGSLWVMDAGSARALRYGPLPAVSHPAAAQIIGRTSFTDYSDFTGATAQNFNKGCCDGDIAVANGKMVVSDSRDHRVMIWNPTPERNGEPVSFVLGQTSPTVASLPNPGTSAAQMNVPSGVWTDGTRVAVADVGNNRVLIWSSFPTTNGQAASVVLGQASFGPTAAPKPPTAASMNHPRAVYSDGTRFYVSDTDNDRVLVWNSFPTTNGQAADFVIGQESLTGVGFGTSDTQLSGPRGLVVVGQTLYVADTSNHRVVGFNPLPSASGAHAKIVIGQPDFRTKVLPTGPSAENLEFPQAVTASGTAIFVTDTWQHRVLRFDF